MLRRGANIKFFLKEIEGDYKCMLQLKFNRSLRINTFMMIVV